MSSEPLADTHSSPIEARRILARACAVIFDFDGVIADSEEFQLCIWREILTHRALPHSNLNINAIAGLADREVIENVVPGLSACDYDQLVALKNACCRERAHEIKPVPGSQELLEVLSKRKHLYVCSSSREADIRSFLSYRFPKVQFRGIIARGAYKRPKPAPDPYLEAIRFAGLPRPLIIAIEDSDVGVASAIAAGINVIRLDRYGSNRVDRGIASLWELVEPLRLRDPEAFPPTRAGGADN